MTLISSTPRGLVQNDYDPRPTKYHQWNPSNFTFELVPDALNLARVDRKNEIEQERRVRNTTVISYDDKNLDGDATAQKNLADKLAGVKERLRLSVSMDPAIMVWKDADNLIHTWNDLQAYCDWLAGYVIALEDRGTRLYAAAWQHKLNLEALTTVEDILAYDITAGWPA